MIRSHATLAVFAILICAGLVLADGAAVVRVSGAADPVPGRFTVTPFFGDLPDPPRGEPIAQMPGWPIVIGANANFAPTRGAVFADLNSDGDLEIIVSSTDQKIYAWDYTGQPMPGFPVQLIGMAQWPPSVGDLDGDGDPEIVQGTRGITSGGRLYAIDHTGQVLPGFPVSFNGNNTSFGPTLYDLDGDGQLEIIAAERDYPIGYLHIVEPDGTEWSGNWPFALDHVPTCTAAVADVDNDASPEIFYMSYNSMYLIDVDGTVAPGWPRQIPGGNFSYQSPALADLDDDGDLEIVVGAHQSAAGCYVFYNDGNLFPGWPQLFGTWTYCPPTVTDLEDDGQLEIIDGRAGYLTGYSDCFWVWDVNGNVRPGFPYGQAHGGGSEGPLTVADIDNDGVKEIFADHNMAIGGQGFLFGVDASGNDLPGFPLRPQGFTYMNGATVGDVDGDGDYELGVVSYDGATVWVNLYDLPGSAATTPTDWPTYHARNTRGGELRLPGGIPGDFDGDGDVDIADFSFFVTCFTGSGVPCSGDCCAADLDGDGDVDIADFAIFASNFTGSQ